MDIFEQIARDQMDERKKLAASDFIVDTSALITGEVPPKLKTEDYLKAANGFIYSAVSAIADEIGAINIKLYEMKGSDVNEVDGHEITDTLYRANNFTTKFDMMWQTAAYLELTGEAPWFLNYGKTATPRTILLLRPDRLTIEPGQGDDIIGGYWYKTDFNKKIFIEQKELVFLRIPDLTRQFRGRGTLEAAAKTADIENYSEEYNRKFFYNSGRPDSAFSTEQKLTKTQREALERTIKEKYRGLSNAHKTVILEQGLKWQPFGFSQKDMDFDNLQKFSRDKIFSIFRTPKSVVGVTDDVNRANAEAGNYVFALRKIRPAMTRIVEQLNEFFVPRFDDSGRYFLDFDDPVPENNENKVKYYESGLTNGYLTINEVREMEGREPVEGGDTPRIPIGQQPLDFSLVNVNGKMLHKSIYSRARVNFKRYQKKEKIKNEAKELIKKQIYDKIVPLIATELKLKRVKSLKLKASPQEFEKAYRVLHAKHENKITSQVIAVFKKQGEEILNRMPEKAIKPSDYKLDPEEWAKAMVRLFTPTLIDLVKEQSKEAFALIGLDNSLDFSNPVVRTFLTKRIFRFSTEITKTNNDLLGRQLADGVDKGESIIELRKRVQNVFEDMAKARAVTIARSETTRAANFAHLEAYKESNIVDAKEWLTAFDERTCEWCSVMNGKVVALNKNFFNNGSYLVGKNGGILSFDYESIKHPPLHPNCRCTLIPVI